MAQQERRGGGRKRRAAAATQSVARQPNYRQLRHPFAPQTVFSDQQVHDMHDTALRVVKELGIKVLLPEARDIFAKAGAIVDDDEMVYIDRDIVEAALMSAPSSIRLRSVNPAREQRYEEGAMLFMSGAGCPNVHDFERGRRPGDLQSYEETVKLAQHYDVLHMFGPSLEPQDVPPHLRHYDLMRAQLEFGDKPMFVYSRGTAQVTQCLEMIQLAHNISDAEMKNGVWASTVINTNSPRMIDKPMAQGLIDFARAGQMPIVTPFCLAGAMAPITVAGALTLQHAEALAAITLNQLANPGAPVSYGGFSSNVDMKSGSPAFGTPEHMKMEIGAGQLARHIGLPWRSATGAASNTPDMQAALETTMALWGAAIANATLTVHTAGWLEGGLTFGYEKFINDIEGAQMLAEMSFPTDGSSDAIGWDALADVGPGGHFFATQHTMDRYDTEFYAPIVADLQNHGSWEKAGAKTSAERATDVWKKVLADFTPPTTGAEAAERLAPFIEAKTKAGGAPLLD